MFYGADPTDELKAQIAAAYTALGDGVPAAGGSAAGVPVAVRSSANAEDLPDLSFAGQQDTYLNVRGLDAVIAAVCNCWASLWTARAIAYRHENAIAHDAVAMAVVVQTMVPAEVSGILFTVNPVSGDRDEMIVNSGFGLGEAIVGGEITPDTFVIDRETQALQEVRDLFRGAPDEEEFETANELAKRVYPDRDDILFYIGASWPVLQRFALELGRRLRQAGIFTRDDDVYYLQRRELEAAIRARYEGRPAAELTQKVIERRELREARKRLAAPVAIPKEVKLNLRTVPALLSNAEGSDTLEGIPVSPGKITGEVSVIHSPADFDKMKPGTILVCPMTTPARTQLFAHTTGLVTDIGSITAHGAIVAREYGIPAVLGLGDITQRLRSGKRITIDGDMGIVTINDAG